MNQRPLLQNIIHGEETVLLKFFQRSVSFAKGVPGAGFEPAKLYAEDLESTPFDRSGTPAYAPRLDLMFLTIALHQIGQDLSALAGGDSE